jgi:hypothetical protein
LKIFEVPSGPEEKMVVAGAEVGVNAFAGAKAGAELKGAIQWRNPEDKKKSFEGFAEIAPTVGGMAGIGAGGTLTVQYTKGIFKVHADAAVLKKQVAKSSRTWSSWSLRKASRPG